MVYRFLRDRFYPQSGVSRFTQREQGAISTVLPIFALVVFLFFRLGWDVTLTVFFSVYLFSAYVYGVYLILKLTVVLLKKVAVSSISSS